MARVTLTSPGKGKIVINGVNVENYIPRDSLATIISQPLSVLEKNKEFDICYGYYPNETFKFSDFNGNLNGGNYKVIMVRMNAVW